MYLYVYILRLSTRNDVCNCTVSHGISTFHAKRGLLHTNPCLRGETRSVIVLFHMGFRLSARNVVHLTLLLTGQNEISLIQIVLLQLFNYQRALENDLENQDQHQCQLEVIWGEVYKDLPKVRINTRNV